MILAFYLRNHSSLYDQTILVNQLRFVGIRGFICTLNKDDYCIKMIKITMVVSYEYGLVFTLHAIFQTFGFATEKYEPGCMEFSPFYAELSYFPWANIVSVDEGYIGHSTPLMHDAWHWWRTHIHLSPHPWTLVMTVILTIYRERTTKYTKFLTASQFLMKSTSQHLPD